MKTRPLQILCFPAVMLSCQDAPTDSHDEGLAPDQTLSFDSIEMIYFPNGVIDDVRYRIRLNGSELSSFTNTASVSRDLGALQTDSVEWYANSIRSLEPVVHVGYEGEGGWGFALYLDEDRVFETNSYSPSAMPSEVRSLVVYLERLSGIELVLYSFS